MFVPAPKYDIGHISQKRYVHPQNGHLKKTLDTGIIG